MGLALTVALCAFFNHNVGFRGGAQDRVPHFFAINRTLLAEWKFHVRYLTISRHPDIFRGLLNSLKNVEINVNFLFSQILVRRTIGDGYHHPRIFVSSECLPNWGKSAFMLPTRTPIFAHEVGRRGSPAVLNQRTELHIFT